MDSAKHNSFYSQLDWRMRHKTHMQHEMNAYQQNWTALSAAESHVKDGVQIMSLSSRLDVDFSVYALNRA